MEHVVERVLTTMRQRLGEQLTLDDLAETAMFSKFYFARMFRQTTGLPPRRFLYALRLQEAKRMLVMTPLRIADISNRVGYHSVGTFTSRFTASVGVPPAVYRRLRGNVSAVLPGGPVDPAAQGRITGRVEGIEEPAGRRTVIGLFPGPVPEGLPARCHILAAPGDWAFQHVPEGRWYVLGVALAPGAGAAGGRPMMGMTGPLRLSPALPTASVTVRLRPMRPIDPPILAGVAGPPY